MLISSLTKDTTRPYFKQNKMQLIGEQVHPSCHSAMRQPKKGLSTHTYPGLEPSIALTQSSCKNGSSCWRGTMALMYSISKTFSCKRKKNTSKQVYQKTAKMAITFLRAIHATNTNEPVAPFASHRKNILPRVN